MENEGKSTANEPNAGTAALRLWRPQAGTASKVKSLLSGLKATGKRFEDAVREARYRVSPRNLLTYAEMVTRRSGYPDGAPVVACDFRSPLIDFVGGRYLYHLMHDLVSSGLTPSYRRNYRFLASMRSKTYKRMLLDMPLNTYRSESELPQAQLLVTDCPRVAEKSQIERVVLIDYTHRRAEAGEFALRFGLNPTIVAKRYEPVLTDLDSPRPNGVYFAGNIDDKGYDRDVLRDRYGVVTRRELIQLLHESDELPTPFVPNETGALDRLSDGHPIALAINAGFRVPPPYWLRQMADADFFLGCPGTQMPMCHNLIEALAVGTIPILEYENYTEPGLQDGVNCLTFRGTEDMIRVVRRALDMDEAEKARLRRGAQAFYQEHHAPGRMIEQMLAVQANPVTLVMNDYRVPRPDAVTTTHAPTIPFAPPAHVSPESVSSQRRAA